MRIHRLSLLASVFLFGFSANAMAQQTSQFEGGKICYTYQADILQNRLTDGTCPADSFEHGDDKCLKAVTYNNNFTFILNDDNSMDFGFSYWFPTGVNCGVIGIAKETENGWLYVNDTLKPTEKCEIEITMDDTNITLNAVEGAECKAQCGSGAGIVDMKFPISYIESKNVWPVDLTPERIYNASCK